MNEELATRIVRVLALAGESPDNWPEELRADLHQIRARYDALKWDATTFNKALHQAKIEWVQGVLQG